MNNHDVFEFELFNTSKQVCSTVDIMKKHAHAHAGPSLLTKFQTTHKDMSLMYLFRKGRTKILGR